MAVLKQNVPTLCVVKNKDSVQKWVVMLRGDKPPVILQDLNGKLDWKYQEVLEFDASQFLDSLNHGGVSDSILTKIKGRLLPAPG